ncbi:hypothetical protein [uncultured Mucilaginibacter sp.]|uniref:hypothetical protein n=1 Tax=uncultured Mucilaginibacter sp. TaxID=797541 RepID=UPI0025E6250D|nr:hypothetical protein [uncultured Mucilaginibacter sp.]
MKKLICLFFMTIPVAAIAQKALFLNEFNGVNNWFFSQSKITVAQKYFYYADSAMTHPADSSVIMITRNYTAIDYKGNGLESFSDSGYMVKLNQAGGYMIVSKTAKIDSTQLKAVFSQGFSGFTSFIKKVEPNGFIAWELSGGKAGITSAILLLDLKAHQIKSLLVFMAANHPLVRTLKKAGQATVPTVIIKVDYEYLPDTGQNNSGTLSDFININAVNIAPSEKYKGYRIKLIPGKQ